MIHKILLVVTTVVVSILATGSRQDDNQFEANRRHSKYYDTFTGKPTSLERVARLHESNLIPWCAKEIRDCNPHEQRRMDHSCNNLKHPSRGASLTPFHRMLPADYGPHGDIRTARSGKPLPNVRRLRVDLMSDGRVPDEKFTNLVPNMMLYMVGDSTTVHDVINYMLVTLYCCQPGAYRDPRCIPIIIPDDDPHLRETNVRCLNLTRSYTYQRLGCVSDTVPGERLNAAAPMLDASVVYGHDERVAQGSREYSGGRLQSEFIRGKEWPRNGSAVCIQNEPPEETRCHSSAAFGQNGVMGLNLASMWILRQHNNIARRLEAINPCWDDDQLYYTAREINIAAVNQILYYELLPSVMGYKYLENMKVIFPNELHVDDYNPNLEPRVSIEYMNSVRWFHTLQEGRYNLYDNHGKLYGRLNSVELTLRTGILPINNTIEGLTQGTFRQACAANDYTVDPDVGERVLGNLERVSDVVSSDIMKGRDLGIPAYKHYRKLCGLPVAKTFNDLLNWMPVEQVDALKLNYESVEDVELMVGIIAEKPMPGAVMGPTLACILTDQLLRWRRADRFWYEHPNRPMPFTKEQLQQIRRSNMAKLLCDQGDKVDAVQPNPFIIPGPHNPIVDCSHHERFSLEPWKDATCEKRTRTSHYHHQYVNHDDIHHPSNPHRYD